MPLNPHSRPLRPLTVFSKTSITFLNSTFRTPDYSDLCWLMLYEPPAEGRPDLPSIQSFPAFPAICDGLRPLRHTPRGQGNESSIDNRSSRGGIRDHSWAARTIPQPKLRPTVNFGDCFCFWPVQRRPNGSNISGKQHAIGPPSLTRLMKRYTFHPEGLRRPRPPHRQAIRAIARRSPTISWARRARPLRSRSTCAAAPSRICAT